MPKPQPLAVQLFDLILLQLSNWRWTWRGMVVVGTLTPLLSIAAQGAFGRTANPPAVPGMAQPGLVRRLGPAPVAPGPGHNAAGAGFCNFIDILRLYLLAGWA